MMANEQEKQQRKLQDAVDAALSTAEHKQLMTELEKDANQADEFSRLRQVDRQLRSAPLERAPQRMAAQLMAQIAQGAKLDMQPERAGLAMALGLLLLAGAVLPLLVAASWLLLNAVGSLSALMSAFQTVLGVVALGISALPAFVTAAENILTAYPAVPIFALLVPVALYGLYRYLPATTETA